MLDDVACVPGELDIMAPLNVVFLKDPAVSRLNLGSVLIQVKPLKPVNHLSALAGPVKCFGVKVEGLLLLGAHGCKHLLQGLVVVDHPVFNEVFEIVLDSLHSCTHLVEFSELLTRADTPNNWKSCDKVH